MTRMSLVLQVEESLAHLTLCCDRHIARRGLQVYPRRNYPVCLFLSLFLFPVSSSYCGCGSRTDGGWLAKVKSSMSVGGGKSWVTQVYQGDDPVIVKTESSSFPVELKKQQILFEGLSPQNSDTSMLFKWPRRFKLLGVMVCDQDISASLEVEAIGHMGHTSGLIGHFATARFQMGGPRNEPLQLFVFLIPLYPDTRSAHVNIHGLDTRVFPGG